MKKVILFFLFLGIFFSACVNVQTWPPQKLSDCDNFEKRSIGSGTHTFWVDQDDCYASMAVKLKDEKVCANISSSMKISQCKEQVSAQADPVGACLKKTTNEEKDSCLFQLTNRKDLTLGLEACAKISCVSSCNYVASRDYCYNNLGVSTLNKSVCEKVLNENMKNSCVSRIEEKQ